MKRNWLIRRLMGAESIFSDENVAMLSNCLSSEDRKRISNVRNDLSFLQRTLSKSKYKE
jgi:hypothetical protein